MTWAILDGCAGCFICERYAEGILARDEAGLVVIARQPTNEQEEAACREAAEMCPREVIVKEAANAKD